MSKICNLPISKNERCKQPVQDGKLNCNNHGCNISADQLGQNSVIYEKDGQVHAWAGEPDGQYCLLHNGSDEHTFSVLCHEIMPCCLDRDISWHDEQGMLHREDGPAVLWASGMQKLYRHGELYEEVWPDGTKAWYQQGELHRDDGLAIIRRDGTQEWYQYGELHRDGKPAIIRRDCTEEWYQHGELHRDGDPAIVRGDGTKEWYQHGELHREDGPAVIKSDGTEYYYWHGRESTKTEYDHFLSQLP